MRAVVSLTLFCVIGSLPKICYDQPRYEGFYLVLLYLLLSCLVVVSWRLALFLKGHRRKVDLRKRGAEGNLENMERGETVLSIYYRRKIMLNKRKKENKRKK